MKRGLALLFALLLSACCQHQSGPAQGARLDIVINKLKKQIADLGKFNIKIAPRPNEACGSSGGMLVATPSEASISLKTVATTVTGVTGQGNIPISYVIITPNVGYTYTGAQTQSFNIDMGIDAKGIARTITAIPPQAPDITQISAPNSQTAIHIDDKNSPSLGAIVQGVLAGIMGADHAQKPCFLPKQLKLEADFAVTNKLDEGISINFVVAKFGATASQSSEDTQSIVLTLDMKGSTPQFEQELQQTSFIK